ncbi:hypothetical protein [Amycolatopsis sp. NPDC054798]
MKKLLARIGTRGLVIITLTDLRICAAGRRDIRPVDGFKTRPP